MGIKVEITDQDLQRRQLLDWAVKQKFDAMHLKTIEDNDVANATLSGIVPVVRREVSRFIDQIQTQSPVGMIIMGAIGCGKSSVLSMVHRSYLDQYRHWIVDNFWDAEISKDCKWGVELIKNHRLFQVMHGVNIAYIRHDDLINTLRDISKNEDSITYKNHRVLSKRIVMIDDYLYNYDDKSDWNVHLENQYLDYRYRLRLPTLIATNLTGEQLRNIPGRQRLVDRMGDSSWLVAVNYPGGSRRK